MQTVSGPFFSNALQISDTNTRYATVANNSALNFGTGDFTVEAFYYRTGGNSDWRIIGPTVSGGYFFGGRQGKIGVGRSAVAWDLESTSIPTSDNAWNHVAYVRSGSTLSLFYNGTRVATATNSNDYGLNGGSLQIGAEKNGQLIDGYIAQLRIAKGVAFYNVNSASIAVPAAPLTAPASDTTDSLVDVPTNGSEVDTALGGQVRGNYCTWNPLDKSSSVDLSNGNLTNVGTTTNVMCRSTIFVSSGKWYYEVTLATYSGNPIFGWASSSANLASWVGNSTSSWGYAANAMKYSNGGGSSYGASFGAGDVVGVAADLDAGTLVFYKNGVSQGTAYSNLSGALCPAFSSGASTTVDFNFGQRPFAYTAPSGFKALCTANLPAPVVTKPSEVMDVKLYTGNGSTQTISTNFSPDFLWFKARGDSGQHALYDIVRGASKSLVSNSTASEATEGGGLVSFDSAGFSLSGDNTIQGSTNGSGRTYAAWCWDAGSSTVTNTQGSITSSVRANASAGFSIAEWSSSSALGTIGHGLGVAPSLILAKCTNTTSDWWVYHASLGNTLSLALNTTAASTTNLTPWNNTSPTSSVFTFTLGQYVTDWVAYCFAPVSGYASAFSYSGNGSTDGPMVYLGFRPALMILKRTDSANDWGIFDNKRLGYNPQTAFLFPNASYSESASDYMDLLSNGFKIRRTNAEYNASGGTYVGFAWAESPFQYARAR
jgi:hypothetical protein